ncbi:MAG: OmpH family outer membrane protein [Desulfuromonadales bacterium]|nr:MAG: OmpH family outer membrane protein [Desulfuromonadales bacterium]
MKRMSLIALLFCFISVPAVAEEPAKTEVPPATAAPQAAEAAKAHLPVKIGYLDIAKIAGDSVPGKAANARMKEKTDKYRSQITARQKKLEKMKGDIEAKLSSLTPQQREAKVKELEKKVGEYQKYVQDAEKEMRKMESELTESMLKSIEKAATEYGKANGFAAIVPKRDLLYLGDMVEVKDVTEEIVKIIH